MAGGAMMGMEQQSGTGGATLPPSEKVQTVGADIEAQPLICVFLSKEPWHPSSLYDTCCRDPYHLMTKALCGFQSTSPDKLKSAPFRPLTHSVRDPLLVDLI